MNICIIGTCRLQNPLFHHGHISECGLQGQFVHTTPEIIQRIDFLKGNLFLDNMVDYIFRKPIDQSKFRPIDFDKVDLFVIEVCSIKLVSFNEFYLQGNKLDELLLKEKEHNFDNWMKAHQFLRDSDKNKELCKVGKNTYNIFDVLSCMQYEKQTYEMLENDLKKILDSIDKPTLFVNHINMKKPDGCYIETRDFLCRSMNDLSKKLKFNIFNPNEIVSKYDPKKMLMNEGTDMNHYSDFGEKVIGEYLVNKIGSILNERN